MPGEIQQDGNTTGKIFLTIKEGSFRQKVEDGVPGAVRRDFINPSTGKEGHVYELGYRNWAGTIERVEIKELDFGRIMEVDLGDAIINIPVDKQYFIDLASKMPALDLKKEVIFTPYDFEADGKRRTGISVMQEGEKIKSFFYDGKKNLHKMPSMKEENPDSDDWKMYFMGVRKFLVNYIKEMNIGTDGFVTDEKAVKDVKDAQKEVTAEDLPF